MTFLSTPSGWRATCTLRAPERRRGISIHALRVEGDVHRFRILPCIRISIHALRVEGDPDEPPRTERVDISIHALRVEGDGQEDRRQADRGRNFYPRPPGGGRRLAASVPLVTADFYPRPPGGGRRQCSKRAFWTLAFLSTPSGWRATFDLFGHL